MKVIHLVEAMGGSTHLWGKERVIQWLAQAQRASGEVEPEVVVFTPGLLADVMREEGFRVRVLGNDHRQIPLDAIKALRALLAGESVAPVLHTHGYKANVCGRAARMLGAPMAALVGTSHGFDSYARRLAAYNAIDRFTAYASDAVTVTDPRMAAKFPPGVRPLYVANALPDAPLPPSADRVTGRRRYGFGEGIAAFGMLHRLIPQKGVEEFIEAARFTHRWGRDDIRWVVTGEGPLRATVEAAAAELPNLVYLGYVDPPDAYLAGIDAFVQPSRSEGLSLALLQAMRAGRPIVATRVGATEETVDDGTEAMVVDPLDPAAIAASALRLADDPVYAAKLGAAARLRFEREFRIERQHRDFLAIYASRVAKRAATV